MAQANRCSDCKLAYSENLPRVECRDGLQSEMVVVIRCRDCWRAYGARCSDCKVHSAYRQMHLTQFSHYGPEDKLVSRTVEFACERCIEARVAAASKDQKLIASVLFELKPPASAKRKATGAPAGEPVPKIAKEVVTDDESSDGDGEHKADPVNEFELEGVWHAMTPEARSAFPVCTKCWVLQCHRCNARKPHICQEHKGYCYFGKNRWFMEEVTFASVDGKRFVRACHKLDHGKRFSHDCT